MFTDSIIDGEVEVMIQSNLPQSLAISSGLLKNFQRVVLMATAI